MAEAFKVVETEQLSNSEATIYTTPDNTKSQVTFCVACSISSSNVTMTIKVTPSGGSAATYVNARTVPATKTDLLPEILGLGLDAGDSIQAFASATASINLKLRILEST